MTKEQWKQEALEIGQHIVDVYGAEIKDVEIDGKTGNIILYANEHGEDLYCSVTPYDWCKYAKEVKVLN